MQKVITMTAYRRNDYTREVLDSLAACHGVADWLFLPHVEPGYDEVIETVRGFSACESIVEINPERKGLNRNTHAAVSCGAARNPDVLLHIEDDTVLAPDALLWFEWAVCEIMTKKKCGPNVLLASGYNGVKQKPTETHVGNVRKIWCPWGWATNSGGLQFLLAKWNFRNPKCFTCHFRRVYHHTRWEIFPSLSRVQNIGYTAGENGRTAEWYRANHRAPYVADSNTPVLPFVMG